MNYSVLKREFDALVESLNKENLKNVADIKVPIPNGFFSNDRQQQERTSQPAPPSAHSKMSFRSDETTAVGVSDKGQSLPVSIYSRTRQASNVVMSNTLPLVSRRELILDLIRKSGTITVKDASNLIKGYSEKTLQRELVSLVSQGVLKREGERRWSKYSLV